MERIVSRNELNKISKTRVVVEQGQQTRTLVLSGHLHSFSMVPVNDPPLLGKRIDRLLLVDEVASVSVTAVAFLGEGVASLGFVGSICFHVYPQFLWSVGKLTFSTVGTEAFLSEVFAKRALGFG